MTDLAALIAHRIPAVPDATPVPASLEVRTEAAKREAQVRFDTDGLPRG